MFRLAIAATCLCALALTACGSSSSSKPDYCDQRAQLDQQIQAIKGTNVLTEGTNTLKSRVDAALTQFKTLSEQAKGDFPKETASLDTAVSSLSASVTSLSDSGTRAAALASLPGQLRTTVDAAKQLQTAVQNTCS